MGVTAWALRRLAVLEAVRGSYDQAVETVGRHCGTGPLGKRQAEQLVRAAAVDIAAFYAAAPLLPQPTRRCWCSASTARGS
ncbi:hypothetical protein OG718_51780 [Streptomyces sp. NBC_00258]|nr:MULTISPECIES: hypothetical protein [unclassified Streptomyces]TRO58131.1 hypothetical protein E4K73_39900 [Streptomyces sp. IB201691-2A2]